MYLLDTNVVSELRRARPHGAVLAWLEGVAEADLHVSAVTLGEIQAGVEITRDQDPERAEQLEHWLQQVTASYGVVPMDGEAFRETARLMHRKSADLFEDAMIAATAIVHRLTVVTRNTRDFTTLGLETLNPFETKRVG